MSASKPGRVYLFGDQTFNYESSLAQLLQSDNVFMAWFFRKCYSAVQTELGRLPLHARDATPKFTSIADLLARKRESLISPALEQALCLIHCFASFIWQHSEGTLPYPTAQDSHLLGLCTGALAAATVSSSQDLTELLPAAVHATVVALHTGLRAAQEAVSILGSTAPSSPSSRWSMVILGISEKDMTYVLERVNSRNGWPGSSTTYISSYSPGGLTISGPPSVLDALSQDDALRGMAKAVLPIRSPYHATHLFSQEDIDTILQNCRPWAPAAKSATSIPVLSCGTGHSVWAATSQGMLDSAVHDVLTRPMVLEKTLDHLSTVIKTKPQTTEILIVPMGTDAGETVQRRLQAALVGGNKSVAIYSAPQRPIPSAGGTLGRSRIAVIGMSGRFPGASSPESLWELMQNKTDMCRQVPELRWNAETHVDPSGKQKNTSRVRWGCWLEQPDLFDNVFFSISPREAPQMDPAQRLALMTAYEALEDAGVVPGRTPSTREDRVGVFYGVTSNDWCESNSGQDLDAYYIPGANRAFIPGRINYFFKFSGPSFAIDTACSSSLAAIHIACNSLWQGDIDMAVAGGTNVLTNPDMTAGLDKGGFLSATGNCKTFDESADGYCRGEGVATVILKRLEDALEDGDPIRGLIGSAFTNHSAEAESITRPHVGAQKDVLERVLNDSGTAAQEVTYVEMHGTGTQAGDTREMNSVCDVLAPVKKTTTTAASRTTQGPADRPSLHVGALKANIGHGESVSGVSALIKVLMMMRKGQIPPHCGIKTRLNPAFPPDLASARNVLIDLEPAAWLRDRGLPRKAIINNFSAAGGNTSILVEEVPLEQPSTAATSSLAPTPVVDRPIYPVAVSAKCARSLKANLRALMAHLSGPGGDTVSLPQLSYTTTARRMHHTHRVIVTADTIHGLKSQLEAAVEGDEGSRRAIPPREMLFAFTGQGSQHAGMGKQLLESLGVFRDQIKRFDQLARRLLGPSCGIMALISESGGHDIAGYSPAVVQLASVCMQVALARIWISWGVRPTAVVGHSLGEYAALNVAGVLSDADTVFLVGRRALLLQEACEPASHAMLAASASVAEVREGAARHGVGVDAGYEVACVNGPRETVLAGTTAQVGKLQQALAAAGIRCTLLKVPYAFHSAQVAPVQTNFAKEARGVVFGTPQLPVLSPLLGKTVRDAGVFGPEYLARHAREPVQMMKCLQSAVAEGVLTDAAYAVEFGPHPVVSGMIKSTLGPAINVLPTLRRNAAPWGVLTKSLCSLYAAGLPVRWDGYFADVPSARTVVELPAYSWDLRSFWIPYRNDWTLTKGDIPIGKHSPDQKTLQHPPDDVVPGQSQPAVVDSPKLESSTSIHRVLEDKVTSQGYDIVVDCDVSRADLQPFIQGHKVDGFGLCTPAVYADIGFSVGTYALKRFQQFLAGKIVTIADLDIKRALISSSDWKQFLRCAANFNWTSKDARVSFTVHDEHGNKVGLLATCRINFVEEPDRQHLEGELPILKSHSDRMRRQCAEDRTCRFTGPMAYRLVSSLAEFNPDYHCIDEVMFDSDSYEAVCRVSFGQMNNGGGSRGDGTKFHIHPGVIDGLTQSGGFVMNANERTKLETDVFVNHGWAEMQVFEAIRDDRQYCTHVRLTDTGQDQLWTGDISIFTDDRIVGLVKGIRIQGVPRRLLKFILSQAAKLPKTLSGHRNPKGSCASDTPALPNNLIACSMDKRAAPLLPVSVTPKASPETSQSTRISIAAKALEIISEQSGVPVSELRKETRFDEIGIDSLLSLMITSLFAEELGISADSTLFLENSTVADMISALEATASSTVLNNSRGEGPELDEPGLVTRAASSADLTSPANKPSAVEQGSATISPNQLVVGDLTADKDTFTEVLKIISEETGVALEQLTEETNLAELGVDSLLALMIGSRLRDELDIDVDTSSVLGSPGSVSLLREALFPGSTAAAPRDKDQDGASSSSGSMVSGSGPPSLGTADISTVSSMRTPSPDIGDLQCATSKVEVPPATSVVLQGSPRTATSALFMFPDGGGLASSYAGLPRIRDDLVVYGINSPYLKKGLPEDMMMDCTWDGMVGSYIAEIRRRQPRGPYSFGGWSAGGILSYRAAQMLMAEGEAVRDLIMIDSPPPENLKQLPEHFFEYCATSGLFGASGGGVAPAWLIAHFRNINRVLSTYRAEPLAVSTLRKANILWACESSVDESFRPQPDDPEDMKFLTERRTDFTAGRWARLFPGVPLHVDRVEGRHHWNLLKGESARNVAAYIARVLA